MQIGKFLFTAAAFGLALPAAAAVTVIGNTSARLCYEAAESRLATSREGLQRCDDALTDEVLTTYDEVATYVNRGILRMRLGDLDGAVADFDQAIARDPDQAEAYLNKGMAFIKLEEEAAAVPLFTAAIEKKTRKPAIAYFGRAVAHELTGEIRQAYFDYKQASLIDPKWRVPKQELSRFTVRTP